LQTETVPDGTDGSAGKRKPSTDKKSSGPKKKEAPATDFREKQKTGPRPNGLREPEKIATVNPTLSPLMEPKHELYSTILTLDRIYSSRCIEGFVYKLEGNSEDGMGAFLENQLRRALTHLAPQDPPPHTL